MRNKRDYSDKKLNEVSLKKGGKSLLRKISINNLKNYSKTPKDNNQKKLFNEGIIERFYKKEKKNNNNKFLNNNNNNKIENENDFFIFKNIILIFYLLIYSILFYFFYKFILINFE